MFFDENRWLEPMMPAEHATYWRHQLREHTGPPGGACPRCGVPRCTPWREAYDQLASGGALMDPREDAA